MANPKRLTLTEFNAIRPYHERFENRNIEAMRRILVERVLRKTVAGDLNLTKEAGSKMVARAWRVHLDRGARPDGWRRVEVILPPEYADVVDAMAKLARNRTKK